MPARELFHKVLTPCIKIWEVRKNSYFKETGNIRLLFTYQSPFYVANSFLWTKQKNNSWMWSCYSELSNKQAANLTHFENFFLPTCLIRTYTFIYFCGKLPPTYTIIRTCMVIHFQTKNPDYTIVFTDLFEIFSFNA